MLNIPGILAATVALAAPTAGIEQTDIFPPQDKHVHGSTIVEGTDGGLLAAWFHGSGERTAPDVVVQGARRPAGAAGWSRVFLMADTPGLPDCNPVLHIDAADRLWLFWIAVRNESWSRSVLKYRRADDYSGAGAPDWDWQDVILLDPGEDFAAQLRAGFDALGFDEAMWADHAPPYDRLLVEAARDPQKRSDGWMTRCAVVELADGRMVLPLYSDGFNVGLAALSDDGGATWRPSAPMVGLGGVQPTLLERPDGTLVAWLRDNGRPPKRVLRSESLDDGTTWSPARDTPLPNPGSSVAAVGLDDGRALLVLNDTTHGRHRLRVALSEDAGATWTRMATLAEAAPGAGSFSYPTAILARDGRVHVTYSVSTAAGNTIRHAAFDPAAVAWRETPREWARPAAE